MGKHLDRITKAKKPSVWKGVWNMGRMGAFLVVFILVAQQLDGWLSLAMWAVAAWYVVMQLLVIAGLFMVVAEVVNEARR